MRIGYFRNRGKEGSGFVLYAVLIVVILSSMVAVSLLYATKSAETASTAGEQGEQAWAVAMSGVYKALQVALQAGPGSTDWKDDPDAFENQLVMEDGEDKWYFSVYNWSGSDDDEGAIVYGLEDEAGKLNLKYLDESVKAAAAETSLMEALNGSEETGSEAWWLEGDDEYSDSWDDGFWDDDISSDISSDSGSAETETDKGSSTLSIGTDSSSSTTASTESVTGETASTVSTNGVSSTNAYPVIKGLDQVPDFEFLDAYIQSSGYGLKIMYGKDWDMNLKADSGTEDVGDALQEDVASGALGMGLRHYLTTVSYDLNVSAEGEERINLNDTNAELSGLGLSEQTLEYLSALWKKGEKLANPAMLLSTNVITVQDDEGKDQKYRVELTESEMETVFDQCSTVSEGYLPGLININTASQEVLGVLFGDETVGEEVVAARENLTSDQMQTPAWLIQQEVIDTETLMRVYPYITTRSRQFHFYVVGYAIPSGRYRVLEVIADTACTPPQPIMIRDLTQLGMPFKIEESGTETIGGVI